MASQSLSKRATTMSDCTRYGSAFLFISVFIAYLLLRLLAWHQIILVEDHDSLVYLDQIKVFRTFDPPQILSMGGFTTVFYPFAASIVSWPRWSLEDSARFCSLLFSSLLFLSLWRIGRYIAGTKEVALGLAILAFSPVLIAFSVSILAEPVYVAIIYSGLWLFWTQYDDPKSWKAALLGVILGLAFLTRIEALLMLLVIPSVQGIRLWFGHGREVSLTRFAKWTLLFASTFLLLVSVQVLRVSHKFGYFAVDERQVWTVARQILDGKSYEEQMNGLNFSPSQINLDYIRSHPEVQARAATNTDVIDVVLKSTKTVIFNLDDFYRNKLNILFGPLGLLFFGAGLFAIWRAGRPWDGILILAFVASSLVGPLLYQIQIRYIAVIAPIMMLIEGIGIAYVARAVSTLWSQIKVRKNILSLVFLGLLVVPSVLPLYWLFTAPPTFNGEYSPGALREPIRIVKNIADTELRRPATLSARKGYVIHYADAKPAALPYTSIDGLVKFCELNGVDFVFLEHRLIQGYPFLDAFTGGKTPPGFVLLHEGIDPFGGKLQLFRFSDHAPAASQTKALL